MVGAFGGLSIARVFIGAFMKNVTGVSFARDIRPLFRPVDIEHMKPMGILLDDFTYMSDSNNAQAVYDSLTGDTQPRMPINGPYWPQDKLDLFQQWMKGGYQP